VSTPEFVTPRPSAAIVLLRDDETGGISVCMVRRHTRNAFMPGVYVFPGGTVNASDGELEAHTELCRPLTSGVGLPLGAGLYAAAIRECFEEAGILLAERATAIGAFDAPFIERLTLLREDLNLGNIDFAAVLSAEGLVAATDHMVHWSHWITPEGFPRRFDTHFFLTRMPDVQKAVHDPRETTEVVWVRPESALQRFKDGDFPLVYATERQLEQLVGLPDTATALAHFAGCQVRTNRPRVVRVDEMDTIVLDDA
jgi:8-oxo-dGTP pyrophosphatase MutT (NUDIX family)